MRKSLKILLGILAAVILLGGIFVIWGETPAKPMSEALHSLDSNSQVQVTTGKWLVFQPKDFQPDTGFIFYPGGRVDFRAYAPAAHSIAAQGILTIIVPMPLNLAVLDPNAAEDVIAAFPHITHWFVGGHSLGGSMAAYYLYTHPGNIDGLILWASYPASSNDLTTSGAKVLSISGTNDGLSTPDKIEASRSLLPMDTRFLIIEGGNHAQFGWYGAQAGDNSASVFRADQQQQVVQATVDFIKNH